MRINSGILWMLIAAFLFACMGVSVKTATATATPAQAVFFRAFVGVPFLMWISQRNRFPLWGVGHRALLVLRGVFGFLSLASYFYSIAHIPLGNAVILNATAPVFVVLWAGPVLGERVPKGVILLLPLFLVGVAMIVKPSWSLDWIPSLAAFASGFFGSMSYVTVRKLGKTEHTTTVVLYFSVVALAGSIPLVALDWSPVNSENLPPLVLTGLLATAAQLAMTRAYKLERASVVSLYSYGGPVFAYILALVFFHEIPDGWALAGTALIVMSAVLIYRKSVSPQPDF